MEKPIISHPPSDPMKRFVLGKEGNNCLLVVCLNPSTADINGLDDTTRNVEKIAVTHGYNGWILFNLSAQRSTKPEEMHSVENDPLHTDNIIAFHSVIDNKGFKDVLFAWGNNIEIRPYLAPAAREFIKIAKEKNLNPLQINLTQKGHPFHPASQALSRNGGVTAVKLRTFNVNQYLRDKKY